MSPLAAPELASIVRPGVIWWTGATVVLHEHALDPLLAEAEARVRISPPAESAAVRTMYKKVGIDPTKTRPSNEALLRRVRKGDAIPRINSAVDIVNWCSLEFQLPYGLYDASKIEGAVTMRLGREGEKYAGIRKDEVNVGGRITVADDARRLRESHVRFRPHDGDARDDRAAGRDLRADGNPQAAARASGHRDRGTIPADMRRERDAREPCHRVHRFTDAQMRVRRRRAPPGARSDDHTGKMSL